MGGGPILPHTALLEGPAITNTDQSLAGRNRNRRQILCPEADQAQVCQSATVTKRAILRMKRAPTGDGRGSGGDRAAMLGCLGVKTSQAEGLPSLAGPGPQPRGR